MKNTTFPTVLADRMLASWHDVQWGEMVIHLECLFEGHLDEQRLAKALLLALDAEPVLGCRFVTKEKQAFWQRVPDEERVPLCSTADPVVYREFAAAPFDPRKSQSLQACLLRQGSGDCLLFRISHVAADAAGCREAVGTVAYIYRRLRSYPDWVPEPNLRGERGMRLLFKQIPWKERWKIFSGWLRSEWRLRRPVRRLELPVEPIESVGWAVRHLDSTRVSRIAAWGRQRQATLNDLFVAAFLRAISMMDKRTTGLQRRLRMTVDLRRYLPDKATGGVCNFSAFEVVDAGPEPFTSYPEAVARVVAYTSGRKGNRIGFTDWILAPLLRRFSYPTLCRLFTRMRSVSQRRGSTPNTLTNTGVIPPHVVDFGIKPRDAHVLVPLVYAPLVGVGVSGFDGSVTFSAGVSQATRPHIEQLLDLALAELPH